jgi:very-short-patch-repair endonuclease
MTRAEHQCYDALVEAVGKDYYIFPQAHLTSIVDHKIKGQNWRGAFRHIDEKSVDFVLCDKNYIAPRLAIELDDRTHERMDRKLRDGEVERILRSACLPLLRLDNHGQFNSSELSQKIKTFLVGNSEK